VRFLLEEGRDLIEMLGMGETMEELAGRIANPERRSAAGRLTRGILEEIGVKDPMRATASDFNRGAEAYYREKLRRKHMNEALQFLEEVLVRLDRRADRGGDGVAAALSAVTVGKSGAEFVRRVRKDLLDERLPAETLRQVIALVIACVCDEEARSTGFLEGKGSNADDRASVHRAGNR
jgi:hypothetical protein